MQLIGIEIGHAATRVAAFDLESATMTASASASHDWIEGLADGFSEQDPVGWIQAVGEAMRGCLEAMGKARREVVAIGVTGPAGGMVVLDENDRVVRPAKLGCDGAAVRQVEAIGRAFGGAPGLIELTGNAMNAGSLAAQLLWLKQHEREYFGRVARVMSPHDFIGYWLTGEMGTSAASAVATGLYEVPVGEWCGDLVDFIDPRVAGMLPPLLEADQARGNLREGLGKMWGLGEKVLVGAGAVEEAAALFASGAALPGDVVADLSAKGSLTGISKEPAIDFRGEGAVGCDLAGNAYTRIEMRNAVAAPELIRRHYGWSRSGFEGVASSVMPGADGLLFLPYVRGETAPRVIEGGGVLHGLTPGNFTPANLARAAVEGVALGFGYALSRLADLGFEGEAVRLSRDGGPTMNQLLADVFGLPVTAVSGEVGPLLGAAMQAAVVYFRESGETLEFDEIAGYMVTLEEVTRCEPDAGRHETYKAMLARQQYLVETLHGGGFL